MSCEHLICAACAAPVIEGRCGSCRTARADVHVPAPLGLTPQLLAVVVLLVALLTALALHSGG